MTPNKLNTEATPQFHTLEALKQLIPACFIEVKNEQGELQQVVDWDTLKQLLGENIADENHERYQFTWAGKQGARLEANKATSQTLRPVPEDSVDWDTTENLYIEGDNLQVLKLLQQGYMGKVKMIYIDPPYNTGNDFVYDDDFARSQAEEDLDSGDIDEEGNRYRKNNRTNGRFHSDWCSMIYPRLLIARSLLTEDGVIFISIDDNEVHNLRKICDEVFGEGNFVAQIIVEGTPKNDPYIVSTAHEYCLVYMKNLEKAKLANYGINNPIYKDLVSIFENNKQENVPELLKEYYQKNKLSDDNIANYKYCDEIGIFRIGPIDDPQGGGSKDQRLNPKTGGFCKIPNRGWSCSLETWEEWKRQNLILFPDNDELLPAKKTYITSDRLDVLRAFFKIQTRKDTDMLKKLFNTPTTVFSNPKPLELIKHLLSIDQEQESIILDFFAGSGTTAVAVMELNLDGKKRRFISVQLPEAIDVNKSSSNKEKKIAKSAIDFLTRNQKPLNIAEIAKERIRRAGQKIKAENPIAQNLDTGFRVLRLADSNFNEVNRHPNEYDQVQLDLFATNIKEDRNDLDLLFGAMLSWGVSLSLPINTDEIDGCRIYNVNDGDLIACFAENVSEAVVKAMASKVSLRVLFRDSCFSEDKHKINIFEIFKQQLGWDEKEAMDKIRVI